MNKLSKLPVYIIEVVFAIMALLLAAVLLKENFIVSLIHLALFILSYFIIKSLKVSDSTKFTLKAVSGCLVVASMTIIISNEWWIISLPAVLSMTLLVVLAVFLFSKANRETPNDKTP